MKKIHLLVFIFLIFISVFLPNVIAQDYTQWHLPRGATARFGKGWVRDIEFSPLGDQLGCGYNHRDLDL